MNMELSEGRLLVTADQEIAVSPVHFFVESYRKMALPFIEVSNMAILCKTSHLLGEYKRPKCINKREHNYEIAFVLT